MDVGDKSLEIEEKLDELTSLIDRIKVLYEQYFMGIQKIAPSQLHHDAERGIRELTQINIRNTALRFRFNTLCQKFGAYNTYWRRTMREIEQGRYIRDISRVKRKAERTGQAIPEEILVAMPKRMRDRIERDRAALAKRAERERGGEGAAPEAGREVRTDSDPALIIDQRPGVFEIDADDPMLDDELDLDQMFASLQADKPAAAPAAPANGAARPAAQEPAPVAPPTAPAAPANGAARPAAQEPAPVASAAPANGAARPAAREPAAARPAAAAPPRAPAAPRPVPPRPTTPAPVSGPGGMSEKETRELYDRYVQARKLVGESTANLTYEKLVKQLDKQASQIMAQHAARAVEFSVVLKDDKVILKAKPRK